MFTEVNANFNSTWLLFGRDTRLPSAAYLMPLLLFPGFIWAYLKDCPKTMALHLIGFASWCLSLWIAWNFQSLAVPLLGALFALYWLAGMAIGIKEKLAFVCSQIGLIATWPMLCIFSFYDFQKEITERIKPEHNHGYAVIDGALIFLVGITVLLIYSRSTFLKTHSKFVSTKELVLAFAILTQFSLAPAMSYYFGVGMFIRNGFNC